MIKQEFITREDYFSDNALDYSYLKQFAKDPEAIREDISNNPGVIFGSALDCLLYDGLKEFKKQYYCKTYDIQANLQQFCTELISDGLKEEDITKEFLCDKLFEKNVFPVIKKKETMMTKVTDNLIDYIKQELSYKGKVGLSIESFSNILTAASELKQNKYTKDFFDTNKYDIIYQLAIKFDEAFPNNPNVYKGDCKAMLDQVVIDHVNKLVYPIDLKTMSDTASMFKANFIKYRYDLQATLYTEGLRQWLIHKGYEDYEIVSFKYIVVSSTNVKRPYVYRIKEAEKCAEVWNYTSPFHYCTMEEILENYEFCRRFSFDYPKEMQQNNCIDLD